MKSEVYKTGAGTCRMCGKEHSGLNHTGPEAKTAFENGYCWECGYWEVRAKEKHECVIDGYIYGIGPENSSSSFRGMGGRKFVIEFFNGKTVTTTNLWAGSAVPEKYKDRIPDTARFLGGAERVNVGGITCWSESK